MAKQKATFVDGSLKNGVSQDDAERIFGLLEFFAGYGFNKCVVGETELVDAATDLEAARLLAYRAARLIDEGGDAVLAAAHAKKFATEMALRRIADCIQAMGANGLRAEYPLARHLAGAKIAAYTDGSIEMMNERIGVGLSQVFG